MNLAKFLRTPFLQNTSGRLLLLLALQKQPPEVLYEKRCSRKFRKIHRKTALVCEIFQNTEFFYGTLLGDCFWLFRATLLKWGTANSVGKLQINIHYLETLTLGVPFRYIISLFGRINFQCMSSLVNTVYCQKQPSE